MKKIGLLNSERLNLVVGLGGRFINGEGERFMLEYDPKLEDYTSMGRLSEAAAMQRRMPLLW